MSRASRRYMRCISKAYFSFRAEGMIPVHAMQLAIFHCGDWVAE